MPLLVLFCWCVYLCCYASSTAGPLPPSRLLLLLCCRTGSSIHHVLCWTAVFQTKCCPETPNSTCDGRQSSCVKQTTETTVHPPTQTNCVPLPIPSGCACSYRQLVIPFLFVVFILRKNNPNINKEVHSPTTSAT